MRATIAIDWTGTPAAPDIRRETTEHFGPCGVWLPPSYDLEPVFRQWAEDFGLRQLPEMKGYKLIRNPAALVAVADFVLSTAVTGAAIIDKRDILRELGPGLFHKPKLLTVQTGLVVLDALGDRIDGSVIVYDAGDIQGAERKLFEGRGKEIARLRDAKVVAAKPIASHKSRAIQVADMVAYLIHRHAAAELHPVELRKAVMRLVRSSSNHVRICKGVDLRPYL